MNLRSFCLAISLAVLAVPAAFAQKKYDAGASDREIRIGNTNPYSGPASAFGTIGKTLAAYFRKVNDEGGINGRRISFISYDDAYSPPKTVEMVRRLVEQDQVLLIFQTLGTASNTAIHRYLNGRRVPQLYVSSGASKWNDPRNYPWTMGWQPDYQTEARVYARHILKTRPDAKIAVLFQNDDYGRDYLKGFKDGLGGAAKMIVAEASYELSDATVDSQMVQLQASGANVFFNITTPKFAAQAIRKAYDTGWKPVHYLNSVSSGVASVLTPAGLDKSTGIITSHYLMEPTDPQFQNHAAVAEFRAFMSKYYPEGSVVDNLNVYAYAVAQTLVQALRQSGDQLTRENIMRQAASMKNFPVGILLPGITITTGPDDYAPVEAVQLQRFNGKQWERFGDVVEGR